MSTLPIRETYSIDKNKLSNKLIDKWVHMLMILFPCTAIESEGEKMGFVVNEGKFTYKKISAAQSRRVTKELSIEVVYTFERVRNFSYMGGEMNQENDTKSINRDRIYVEIVHSTVT